MLIFDVTVNFLFYQYKVVLGAYLGKNVTKVHNSNTPKMAEYEPKNGLWKIAEPST